MSIDYAVHLYNNHTPNLKTGIAPIELFTGTKRSRMLMSGDVPSTSWNPAFRKPEARYPSGSLDPVVLSLLESPRLMLKTLALSET
jgi:hypothetical protein